MVHEGTVNGAIDRAVDPEGRGGNFGGMMLAANAETFRQTLSGLEMNSPKTQNDRNPN